MKIKEKSQQWQQQEAVALCYETEEKQRSGDLFVEQTNIYHKSSIGATYIGGRPEDRSHEKT